MPITYVPGMITSALAAFLLKWDFNIDFKMHFQKFRQLAISSALSTLLGAALIVQILINMFAEQPVAVKM